MKTMMQKLDFSCGTAKAFRNKLNKEILQINTEIYRINHNKYGKIVHLMTQMT